jgi:hypothetical protein
MVVVKMRNTFTNEEYTDMLFVYCFCGGSCRTAAVEYGQRYPLGRIPHRKASGNVCRTLRGTGPLPRAKAGSYQRRRWEGTWQQCSKVQVQVYAELPGRLGASQTQVWKILRRDGFCAYSLQGVQRFLPEDHEKRVRFCEWLQPRLQILPSIILLTDEARFT